MQKILVDTNNVPCSNELNRQESRDSIYDSEDDIPLSRLIEMNRANHAFIDDTPNTEITGNRSEFSGNDSDKNDMNCEEDDQSFIDDTPNTEISGNRSEFGVNDSDENKMNFDEDAQSFIDDTTNTKISDDVGRQSNEPTFTIAQISDGFTGSSYNIIIKTFNKTFLPICAIRYIFS